MTTKKYKHLTLSDRTDIQIALEQGKTFKAIGLTLNKEATSISKEVKKHKALRETTAKGLDCPKLGKSPYICNACPMKR